MTGSRLCERQVKEQESPNTQAKLMVKKLEARQIYEQKVESYHTAQATEHNFPTHLTIT